MAVANPPPPYLIIDVIDEVFQSIVSLGHPGTGECVRLADVGLGGVGVVGVGGVEAVVGIFGAVSKEKE